MNELSILRGSYIQNLQITNMEIDIPIPCPSCGGKMFSSAYDAPLKILKARSWQVCKECGFQRSTEEFKKVLCCA